MFKHVFELLPVVLAIASAFSCGIGYKQDRRKSGRIARVLATVASLLLLVAQTSWWVSSTIQHDLSGTVVANAIWTIFNTLVCVVFLLMSWPRYNRLPR